MNRTQILAAAIAAAVTLPTLAQPPAAKPKFAFEKCYGIAAAGKNDCGTATHSCAASSTKGADGASWVYLPTGTCKKIEGGSLTPKS